MAEDIFSEEVVNEPGATVVNEPEVREPETTEEIDKTDMGEGLMAERDPASAMNDPFAVDKSKAEDLVARGLDQQISRATRETGEKLNAMPKDNIMIPIDKQNPHDSFVVVGINGYYLQIQRGKKVSLPRPIVDLLIAGDYGPTLVR